MFSFWFSFSSGNKGDGVFEVGDSVKSDTSFAIMECTHCEPELLNVFTCFEIHVRITKECLEIHQEMME